jgi:hypothetical protein
MRVIALAEIDMMRRTDRPERNRLGALNRNHLRHLLAQHHVQVRNQHEGDDRCDHVTGELSGPQHRQRADREVNPHEIRNDQHCDRTLGNETDADRSDGDAELRRGNEVFRMIHALEHAPRSAIPGTRTLLDACASYSYEGKFGSNEIRIDADEHQHGEEL